MCRVKLKCGRLTLNARDLTALTSDSMITCSGSINIIQKSYLGDALSTICDVFMLVTFHIRYKNQGPVHCGLETCHQKRIIFIGVHRYNR